MATSEQTVRRTNYDVARSMLIVGGVLLAVGVIMTFSSNWFAQYINGGYGGPRDIIVYVWSAMTLIAYPLGSFLIVGAIIVNRLPERIQELSE